MSGELADVLYWVLLLGNDLDIDPNKAFKYKLEKMLKSIRLIRQSVRIRAKIPHRKSPKQVEAFSMAGPTGFEPAISSVTGRRVRPDYTTGPRRKLCYNLRRVLINSSLSFHTITPLKVTNSCLLLTLKCQEFAIRSAWFVTFLLKLDSYNLAMLAQNPSSINA